MLTLLFNEKDKKMKKIIFFMSALLMLIVPMSCDDALDVNTDPQAATSADPNAVLPYCLVQYAARKTTEIGTRLTDVPQYFSATFNSPLNGSTTSFLTGNTWNMYYVQFLGNLRLVENDARAAGESSDNITALAVILQALAFYELSVIWGDIPFTQSLNGQEFPLPEFDSQETVLRGVIDMLNEATTLIDNLPDDGLFNLSTGDLIYGGDMIAWKRFANSLKIRVLMLIRNRDTSVESQIIDIFNSEDIILDNSQATLFSYSGDPGQDNAWKQIVTDFGTGFNDTSEFFGPSETLTDILQDRNDPRYRLFISDRDGNPAPRLGRFPTGSTSVINDNVLRADMPNIWMLPSELNLYKAELITQGVLTGDADAAFRLGVTQAVEFWGQDITGADITLSNSDISDYVASLPNINNVTSEAALEEIYTQQYLEAFLRPLLGWNHIRRTETPTLPIPPNSNIGVILQNFTYPPIETAANPNVPTRSITSEKLWVFDN